MNRAITNIIERHTPKRDFEITNHGSVWSIRAVSEAAKEFAEENFEVESWMGVPTNFTTDWRPARDIVERLASEGWLIRYYGGNQ